MGATQPGGGTVRLLVIDDSALVRQMVTALCTPDRGFEVSVAADPVIARRKMRTWHPDVILLDLEMPRIHGLSFLRQIMLEDPVPVVVCSGMVEKGSDLAIRALEEGAIDVIAKPKVGVRDFFLDAAERFVETVMAAANARPAAARREPVLPRRASARHVKPSGDAPSEIVIAIGASTGGTEAIRVVLQEMPAHCPAILVVQHMPRGYTKAFAHRLDQLCSIAVKEAEDGDALVHGRALIAPGNCHLTMVRRGDRFVAHVSERPLNTPHRPSVDVLFHSVAATAGSSAIGVLLTGMGEDGAAGLLAMRRSGAMTVAQDERTCVVFGMPRAAVRCGAAEELLPLPEIATVLLQRARMLVVS